MVSCLCRMLSGGCPEREEDISLELNRIFFVTSFKKFPDELLKSRQGTASSFSPRQDICANCCAHELP
jgi:hypothetical protein